MSDKEKPIGAFTPEVIRPDAERAADQFARFLNNPENSEALDWLIAQQGARTSPGAPGAKELIWLNEGRRGLAADILTFMDPSTYALNTKGEDDDDTTE